MIPPAETRARWSAWLALNPSTFALLGAILLVTASTELWSPLVPQYVKSLRPDANAAAPAPATILLVALYGALRDALEAINYYIGGALGGRLNTRRSLLLFNLLPLAGLLLVATWAAPAAIFLAVPLIFVWDSIAGPSIITVVGDSVPAERRTMAFSLQSIFRRVARGLAYLISAAAVWGLGTAAGFRAAVGAGIAMLLGAAAMQFRFMHTATRDTHTVLLRPSAAHRALTSFDPQLKRLLWADIFARWAEGLPRELIILYCVTLLTRDAALAPAAATALYGSVLLMTQAVTNVVLYLLVGPLASRAGTAKKPYIGLTFLALALFPLAIAAFGPLFGLAGLVAAFIVGGFREIGEPARKAMISELVDPANKTQMVGLYWSARSLAVTPAPLVGGAVWIAADACRPGLGPPLALAAAGLIGLAGTAVFFARFGRAPASA